MAKFEINVSVNGEASIKSLDDKLKSVDTSAQKASKSTDSLSSSLKTLGGVIASIGIYELAKKTIQTADTMNLLEGRVSLVTKSMNEQIAVQEKLFKVAQNTRQGLEATTSLYTNLASSMTAMGKSQNDIIKMTETVNKAMVISGSSTQQAQAAIMQLGQAFASGTLRGDELNSILENSKGLAQAIADGMGVPIGKLRELGSEGKITSETLAKALEKSASDIEAKFGKMPQTVGQSLTQVENSIMSLVGVADNAVNGSGGLSEIFSYFSKYLDENQASVIEFGSDFLRVMQLIGAGALTTLKGIEVILNGIMGGITSAIEMSINGVLFYINSAISMAETGYNKIRAIGGFEAKTIGRITNVDMGSKSFFSEMKKDADEFNNVGLKTMGKLFDDIANNTTVIKKNTSDLNLNPPPDSIGGNSQTKAQIEVAKKIAEEKLKIANGYLEGYAELEAKAAIATYELQLSYLDSYSDMEAKQAIEQYNQEISNLDAYAELEAKAAIKEFEDKNKLWDDFFSDLDKAMDNQLFDAMSGKWESFGSWLKDFWSSLTTSIARAASSQLSQSLIGGIKNAMGLGDETSQEASWLTNMFKATTGSAVGLGSTLSASQISSLGGVSDAMGFTTTSGRTVVDAAGQITKVGSDLGGITQSISSLNSIYNALTGGLSASIANGFASGAAYTYNGLTAMGVSSGTAGGIAGGIGNFGAGLASPWSTGAGSGMAAQSGAMLGGAALGAAGGYALGTIGDKLFGADTKAAKFGAIGGAIGSLGGPIGAIAGAAIGSLIGGAFGSKKVKDQGLYFAQQSASDSVDKFVMSFVDMQKKSWFSSSSWTDFSVLSSSEKTKVKGIFETYDYLLGALGDTDKIFLKAGKYSGQSFIDTLAKNFISVIKTGGDTTEIYNAWKEYATQIGVTIQEAFGASIQEMITSQRTFQEWAFGSGTIEQIKFTANYLQKDFEALANSMGVSNINVNNFATMYDKAIKANFTPENITKWNSLGQSLMATTDATKAYNEELTTQNSIIDDMLNSSMVALQTALKGVNDIALKTINLFKSLKDSTASLRNSLLSSASGDQTKYYLMQFQDLKKEFLSNFDASGTVYAGNLEKMERDYSKLTDTISSLGGVGTSGQKSALVGQLDIFGQMFDKNAQALSVLIVGDETGSASESTLTNVEQWIKSLYAVQEQANIAEQASLSPASFEAGHQLGTQEKIDFAKATGLTIGSESFNKAIVDIQGFATQSDDTSYLKGLISSGDIASIKALQSIGSTAPSDAISAIGSATSEYKNMESSISAINQSNAIETAKPKYDKALEMMKSYLYGGFDAWSDHGKEAFAYISSLGLPVNTGIRGNQSAFNAFASAVDSKYNSEISSLSFSGTSAQDFSNLVGPYINSLWGTVPDLSALSPSEQAIISQYLQGKSMIGFSQGGYTGDMATNQIAGVTHGQEYVVNAKTTKDLGLNNSGGLFREMANEIKSLKNEVVKLNELAMNQLRETIGGNIIMRQVTNGGNAMMIEVL